MFWFKKRLPTKEKARIAEESEQYQRGYSDGYDRAFNISYDHARDLILFQDALIHSLYRQIESLKTDADSNDCDNERNG